MRASRGHLRLKYKIILKVLKLFLYQCPVCRQIMKQCVYQIKKMGYQLRKLNKDLSYDIVPRDCWLSLLKFIVNLSITLKIRDAAHPYRLHKER